MSLFASFLGNAANAGAEYLGNEIKNENQMKRDEALEKMREELLIKRTETIEAMKRSRDLKAGQDISAEADIIGKARIDKDVQSKMAADPELNGMQPGDQEALDKATPKQLKEVGLLGTMSDTAKLGDKANAATKLGYLPEAREIRGQQDLEIRRDADERKERALVQANENTAKTIALKERGEDRKDAENKSDREVQDKRNELAEKRQSALMTKIAGGNGSKDDTKEWMSIINEQRKGVATELSQIRADKKAELEGAFTPEERKAVTDKFNPAIKAVATKIESIDAKVEAVTNRLLEKSGAPVIEKRQDSPDKAWTPPKNVDKTSALSEAKAAIAKGADPAKVKARLKMMGINEGIE